MIASDPPENQSLFGAALVEKRLEQLLGFFAQQASSLNTHCTYAALSGARRFYVFL